MDNSNVSEFLINTEKYEIFLASIKQYHKEKRILKIKDQLFYIKSLNDNNEILIAFIRDSKLHNACESVADILEIINQEVNISANISEYTQFINNLHKTLVNTSMVPMLSETCEIWADVDNIFDKSEVTCTNIDIYMNSLPVLV